MLKYTKILNDIKKPVIHLTKTRCSTCGNEEAIIVEDAKYNGLRGKCPKCGADWPES